MAEAERGERVWTWMHLASLAGIVAVLAFICRGQWFFGDEWDFLLYRGFHHAIWGFFRPHNEHWSTLPILWYRAVFSAFGVKTYWPYLAGLFAVHLAVVHGTWRLMRRADVNAPLATGVALVVGLFGAGAENLLWAFQIAFVGSLAAGLWLVLAVDAKGSNRRVAAVSLGAVASLMLSGISVVMVGAVGLAALGRWGWRRAAAVVMPAGAIYLAWLKVYGTVGLHGGNDQFHGGPKDIPRYVWGGLSDALGEPLHSRRAGELLLVMLVVVLAVMGRTWWKQAPEVLAVAAAAPVMFAVISQGRGAIQDPSAGRYLYLAAGMVLPLVAFAVHELLGDRRASTAVALVACLGVTASGVGLLRDTAHADRTRELTLRGQMLASVVVGPSEGVISDTPDFMWATDVRVAMLQRLQAKGQLPPIAPTARDTAQARLALQINGAKNPPVGKPLTLGGGTAQLSGDGEMYPTSDGCVDVDLRGANLVVRTAPSAAPSASAPNPPLATFTVTATTRDTLRVFVPYPGGNAGPRVFLLDAGDTVVIQDLVRDDAVFQLPTGVNHVCGLVWRGR